MERLPSELMRAIVPRPPQTSNRACRCGKSPLLFSLHLSYMRVGHTVPTSAYNHHAGHRLQTREPGGGDCKHADFRLDESTARAIHIPTSSGNSIQQHTP